MKIRNKLLKIQLKRKLISFMKKNHYLSDVFQNNINNVIKIEDLKKNFIIIFPDIIYLHYLLQKEFNCLKINRGLTLINAELLKSIDINYSYYNYDFFISMNIQTCKEYLKKDKHENQKKC